jgi:hypothetical protein
MDPLPFSLVPPAFLAFSALYDEVEELLTRLIRLACLAYHPYSKRRLTKFEDFLCHAKTTDATQNSYGKHYYQDASKARITQQLN